MRSTLASGAFAIVLLMLGAVATSPELVGDEVPEIVNQRKDHYPGMPPNFLHSLAGRALESFVLVEEPSTFARRLALPIALPTIA